MSASFLPYGRQAIDESDIEAVAEVLRGDWLTTLAALPRTLVHNLAGFGLLLYLWFAMAALVTWPVDPKYADFVTGSGFQAQIMLGVLSMVICLLLCNVKLFRWLKILPVCIQNCSNVLLLH